MGRPVAGMGEMLPSRQRSTRRITMVCLSAASSALALTVLGTTPNVSAQGVVTTQKLSAALANELVGESVAACAAKGYTVTAGGVDLDGVRPALLRSQCAPIHTLDNAFYK